MPYLLAIVMIVAAAYLTWRLVGAQASQRDDVRSGARGSAPRGPDDDPDFLRSLDRD